MIQLYALCITYIACIPALSCAGICQSKAQPITPAPQERYQENQTNVQPSKCNPDVDYTLEPGFVTFYNSSGQRNPSINPHKKMTHIRSTTNLHQPKSSDVTTKAECSFENPPLLTLLPPDNDEMDILEEVPLYSQKHSKQHVLKHDFSNIPGTHLKKAKPELRTLVIQHRAIQQETFEITNL